MARLHLAIDASKAKKGARDFEASAKKVTSSATKATGGVKKLDSGMSRLGKSASGLKGILATAFSGLAVVSAIRDATSTFIGFEQTMSTVKAVTGATGEEFTALSEKAKEMGASTRFSAREAGEGLVFLARAGFETEEAIAAIPATLNLAAAGALELGEAADYASNILSQFNLAATETERVSNILVVTANSANTSVQQLAEAMKMAGPVAGSLGISIEETSAAIGVLGDSGIQASLAGTNLRGVMSALLGPTSAAEKALSGMGLSLESVDPSKHNLISIFKEFSKANLGAADAVDIFGRRNAAAALIMSASVDKLTTLTKANENSEKAAERAAKIMSDNLSGAFKNLRSSVEEAYLQIGEDGFTGGLRDMVDVTTEALRITLGLSDGTGELGTKAKTLLSVMEALTFTFGTFVGLKLAKKVKNIVFQMADLTLKTKALSSAAVTMNALTAGASGAAAATGGLTTAFGLLKTTLIGHPILAITAVVGAATTAFALFSDKVDEAAEKTRKLRASSVDIEDLSKAFVELDRSFEKAMDKDLAEEQVRTLEAMARNMENAIDKISDDLSDLGTTTVSLSAFEAYEGVFNANKIKDEYIKKIIEAIDKAKTSADIKTALQDASQYMAIDIDETVKLPPIMRDSDLSALDILKGKAEDALGKTELMFISSTDASDLFKDSLEFIKTSIEEVTADSENMGDAFQDAVDQATAIDDSRIALDNMIDSLKKQREIVGLTADEIERKSVIEKAAEESANLLFFERLGYIAAVIEEYDKLQEAIGDDKASKEAEEAAKRVKKEWENTADTIGESFSSAVEGMIFDGESLRDTLKNIFSDISRTAFKQFFSSQMTAMISSGVQGMMPTGAAKGMAFDGGGSISTFASGGVVNSPTVFSFENGGKIGIMGEAGPEAVLPLKRDKLGNLGVSTDNSSTTNNSNTVTRNVNVNLNVNTRDSNSFRKSASQIAADMRFATSGVE